MAYEVNGLGELGGRGLAGKAGELADRGWGGCSEDGVAGVGRLGERALHGDGGVGWAGEQQRRRAAERYERSLADARRRWCWPRSGRAQVKR